MIKEELKELYKSKPELIEEHKRLVNVLRSGSKKEQLAEAAKQLKELKEMVQKADRCWKGYKPTPGKKPYEKGSCIPVEKAEEDKKKNPMSKLKSGVSPTGMTVLSGTGKEVADVLSHYAPKLPQNGKPHQAETKARRAAAEFFETIKDKPPFAKEEDKKQKRTWRIKIKGKDGYHDVKDVKDMGPQKHNAYMLHDGSLVHHHDVEDLDVTGSVNKAEDTISEIKAKYSEPKEIDLKTKIKEVKQKYKDKQPLSEDDKAERVRLKYTQFLK